MLCAATLASFAVARGSPATQKPNPPESSNISVETVERVGKDVRQANLYLNQRNWDAAVDEFRRAAALEPKDFSLRLALVQAELAGKNFSQAAKDASLAITLATSAKEKARAYMTLADAHYAMGRADESGADFQDALAADPSNAEAELGLGQVALAEHNAPQAESDFRKAIRIHPDFGEAYGALARLLEEQGHIAEARSLFEKAAALDPNDWHLQYDLAKILARGGQALQAQATFEKIAKLHPGFLPAREQLALIALREGNVNQASAEAEGILEEHPRAAEGHRVMALVLWRQRNIPASIAECNTALAASPKMPSMLALRAIELWKLNARQQAQADFRNVVAMDSTVSTADGFCRLIACGPQDISAIGEFLRANRWVLEPQEPDTP